ELSIAEEIEENSYFISKVDYFSFEGLGQPIEVLLNANKNYHINIVGYYQLTDDDVVEVENQGYTVQEIEIFNEFDSQKPTPDEIGSILYGGPFIGVHFGINLIGSVFDITSNDFNPDPNNTITFDLENINTYNKVWQINTLNLESFDALGDVILAFHTLNAGIVDVNLNEPIEELLVVKDYLEKVSLNYVSPSGQRTVLAVNENVFFGDQINYIKLNVNIPELNTDENGELIDFNPDGMTTINFLFGLELFKEIEINL
ncbi:hypothetical protein, partial [Xanthovirga aplysinae]|uniref:hypothetical protein n=1 Tax=Xanthovirga aplysinae TaxID=2529853 RepID=UPI001656D760